jgi:hypothetical protein
MWLFLDFCGDSYWTSFLPHLFGLGEKAKDVCVWIHPVPFLMRMMEQ